MKKSILFFLSLMVILMAACGSRQEKTGETDDDIMPLVLDDDSTFYGLVCEGTTDTVLVFLSVKNIQDDPDTFNILAASRKQHVLGQLKVGDNIAVVRNVNDSTVADFVIDMENLQATWCYQVLPTLHVRADMTGNTTRQKLNNLPDSVRELLTIAREYSMQLKADHSVMSRGTFNGFEEENQLVDYPIIKRYGLCHLLNGRLLLSEMELDSLGNTYVSSTDTADFLLMTPDTLVLRFNEETRHYYPKTQ